MRYKYLFGYSTGSAYSCNQRSVGHMPRSMDKMFFRSTRFVLGRFHRPVDRCGVPSVYPVTAGQGCCRLVRTRPSIVSLQYRRFRQSGKYLPHSAQIEIMPYSPKIVRVRRPPRKSSLKREKFAPRLQSRLS